MFNIVFLVGPQATPVRLRYQTAEARTAAMLRWHETRSIADDIGQEYSGKPEAVHATLLSSDESDAMLGLAQHFVSIAANKAVEALKESSPEFKLYVAKVQSAQRQQQLHAMSPGGGLV